MVIVRPLAEVVHRWRSGQPLQATPKVMVPLVLTARVIPAGQVNVAAAGS